jgi:ribosomal protein S18 acetylase RimI-like enzyme
LDEHFGGALQARRGELIDVLALQGFVAEPYGAPAGILTYRIDEDECELAFMAAFERRGGVGTALVDALCEAAAGCRRIWVVTTNDNVDGLRFYQRRGFRLVELRPGAVDEARRTLKPHIGVVGEHGIPIRDELELELPLDSQRASNSLK